MLVRELYCFFKDITKKIFIIRKKDFVEAIQNDDLLLNQQLFEKTSHLFVDFFNNWHII